MMPVGMRACLRVSADALLPLLLLPLLLRCSSSKETEGLPTTTRRVENPLGAAGGAKGLLLLGCCSC
jgi:hypothetical protein